uniref:Uncharacterized protein n=1 Tax=Ditylum brightwellii TaxID=49249 RepID=A0A6U3RXT0_9STRA|mmetsp:Transcript_7167/g.9538  ORF Transcript_7167/g.9538 Transcript_7167/m.9538 type:complete len:231 (-) Transcript_7167:166-858(-)
MKNIIALFIAVVTQVKAFCPNGSQLSPTQGTPNQKASCINRKQFSFIVPQVGNTISLDAYKREDEDTNDSEDNFPMKELYERIEKHRDVVSTSENTSPRKVYVILFHADTASEGMHAIEYPHGSGENSVLAFETKEACETFAKKLEEQRFFDPKSRKIKLSFLRRHCDSIGVSLKFVPKGTELNPPVERVEELLYNPVLAEIVAALNRMIGVAQTEKDGVLVGKGMGNWD